MAQGSERGRALANTVHDSQKWSSEQFVLDQRELQAGCMALDSSGSLALLGGKKVVGAVRLDDNKGVELIHRHPRVFPSQKWDISKIAFRSSSDGVVGEVAAMAVQNWVEITRVAEGKMETEIVLKQHTRPVTDLSWSCLNPGLLASSSLDNFVHVWDTEREGNHKCPAVSLRCVRPVSIVQWNRQHSHTLATCCCPEGTVQLWDIRRPDAPTHSAVVHAKRLLSFDWAAASATQFVTSGADCSVKFFDSALGDMQKPTNILKTGVPVWRARHTPFGDGLATVIIPKLERSNDNSLFLWNNHSLDSPVHCFYGHRDIILDFEWRRDQHELVTWSRDHTLRLWRVDSRVRAMLEWTSENNSEEEEQELAAEEEAEAAASQSQEAKATPMLQHQSSSEGTTLTRESGMRLLESEGERSLLDDAQGAMDSSTHSSNRSLSPSTSSTQQYLTFSQELELLNSTLISRLQHVKLEDEDVEGRKLKFSAAVVSPYTIKRLLLKVQFSENDGGPPTFTLGKGSTLDPEARTKILKALRSSVRRLGPMSSRLEACLRALETQVEQLLTFLDPGLSKIDKVKTSTPPPLAAVAPKDLLDGAVGNFGDSNVPYPRTCGARFSGGVGGLVCFGRCAAAPAVTRRGGGGTTPRAYSAFEAHLQVVQQMEAYQGHQQQQQRRQSPGAGSTANTSSLPGVPSSSSMASPSTSNNNTLTAKPGDTNSLKRTGRFNVRRVRSGSISDSDAPNASSQEPSSQSRSRKTSSMMMSHMQRLERVVIVYDASRLFPFNRLLAKEYDLGEKGDAKASCLSNMRAAALLDPSSERAYLWKVLSELAHGLQEAERQLNDKFDKAKKKRFETPISHHALGRRLFDSILDHVLKNKDVQMAAVMTCVFRPKDENIHIAVGKIKSPSKQLELPGLPSLPCSPVRQLSSSVKPSAFMQQHEHKPTSSPMSDSGCSTSSNEALRPKFWFLTPGALPNLSADRSPYHTIQFGGVGAGAVAGTTAAVPAAASVFSKGKNKRKGGGKRGSVAEKVVSGGGGQQHLGPGETMTSLGSESNLEQFVTPYYKACRSNSWSETHVEVAVTSPVSEEAQEDSSRTNRSNTLILDPARTAFHDSLRFAYADLLHRARLLTPRAAVLKRLSPSRQAEVAGARHFGLEPAVDCQRCGEKLNRNVQCVGCGALVMRCSICRLPVKGAAVSCGKCGHGAHVLHWKKWFGEWGKEKCPAGCGCLCISNDKEE